MLISGCSFLNFLTASFTCFSNAGLLLTVALGKPGPSNDEWVVVPVASYADATSGEEENLCVAALRRRLSEIGKDPLGVSRKNYSVAHDFVLKRSTSTTRSMPVRMSRTLNTVR